MNSGFVASYLGVEVDSQAVTVVLSEGLWGGDIKVMKKVRDMK